MGDRALIQLTDSQGELSPVLYLHWGGKGTPALLDSFFDRFLIKRGADVSYGFARLVSYACESNMGEVLGVGVWNCDALLTADDSHGDAGIFVVDLDKHTVRYGGGYAPKIAANTPWTWEQMQTPGE
jgi:hypothetical protein